MKKARYTTYATESAVLTANASWHGRKVLQADKPIRFEYERDADIVH